MRQLIGTVLMLLLAPISVPGQSAPGLPKPSPAIVNSSPDVKRTPEVVWKRGMSNNAPAKSTADTDSNLSKADGPSVPASPTPRRTGLAPLPSIPLLKVIQPAPPPYAPQAREQVMKALGSIRTGWPRSEVISKLGQPAYSIGMPDGSHYVERCRFRLGLENLASVEMRDGYVTTIDRIAR